MQETAGGNMQGVKMKTEPRDMTKFRDLHCHQYNITIGVRNDFV
jgi:hypothetical protein